MSYDYSGRMRQNRDEWKNIDVKNATFVVPEAYRSYFQAMTAIATAIYLMEKIEEHDPEVLAHFANRRPRLSFTYDELHELRDLHEFDKGALILPRLEALIGLVRDKKKAEAEGKKAAAEGDELRATYWLAREYAITYRARGEYELVKLQIDNRVPDFKI